MTTKQPLCVECGTEAPTTATNYTLISASHGWRLIRKRQIDGTHRMEWRCPTCWQNYRVQTKP